MELEPQTPNSKDPEKVIQERHEVDEKTGCWEWTGYVKNGNGYGEMSVNGSNEYAHRVSYAIHNGDIPDSKWVLHKCHNKTCVNPEHLYVGDVADNVEDAMQEGSFWHRGQLKSGEENVSSKLTEEQVKEIKRMKRDGATHKEVAETFETCIGNVSAIVNGRTWSHVTID